ncbi:hypothetical protein [Streptomyces sp. NPDC086182]|jgi:hypothetical protein|uniref:hypothetical protein n=1 Tax=Streptomyces sp. NPDC086182 TaxID=3155058 RepID=UPI003437DB4F
MPGGSQVLFADQVGLSSDQVTDRTGVEQRRAPDEVFNAGLKRSLPVRSRAGDQARLAAEARGPASGRLHSLRC